MEKKIYVHPVTTIISLNADSQILAGSFDNVADSKPNTTGLWDCAAEDISEDDCSGWVDTGSRNSLW